MTDRFKGSSIDCQDIDEEIKPVCDALNALDGVQTIFSCAGHPELMQGYVTCQVDEANLYDFVNTSVSFFNAHFYIDGHEEKYDLKIWTEVGLCQGMITYTIRFITEHVDGLEAARDFLLRRYKDGYSKFFHFKPEKGQKCAT